MFWPLKTLFSRRYAGAYRRARILFTFDLALIAVILAVGTTALVWYLRKPQPNIVQVTFGAEPKEIRIGDLLDLTISYANRSKKQTFDEVRAEIELPPNFALEQINSSLLAAQGEGQSEGRLSATSSLLTLGALKPGASGAVQIRGVPWGALHDTQRMTVRLHLKDAKTGKVKEEITPFVFVLDHSAVIARIDLPHTIFENEIIEGTLRVRNSGGREIPALFAKPLFPAEFSFGASDPALERGAWTIGALAPNQEKSARVTLRAHKGKNAHPTFALKVESAREGALFLIGEAETPALTIEPSGVSLTHALQGHEGDAPRPGDTVAVRVTLSTSRALKNARLSLPLNSLVASPQSLEWSLGDLAGGATVTKEAKFKIRDSIEASAFGEEKRLILKTTPFLEFAYEGSAERPAGVVKIRGDERETKISTRVRLHGFARYFTEEGDQLGRGPLPPKVGKTTKYWVFWNITNSTNEIKDVLVHGVLPQNVEWTGKISASEGDAPVYDQNTRTITWRVPAIPAVPSERCPCVGASFEVALTPTFDDLGTKPFLMHGVSLAATDSFTGERLTVSASSPLTTGTTDPVAKAKSMVQE